MQITIEIPDQIVNSLQLQSSNFSNRVLELLVADYYRQGYITAAEVRRLLNFPSRWETYEFLKTEKAYLPYSEEDLDQDIASIQALTNRPVL